MKRALLITSYLLLTVVIHAGLTLPSDDVAMEETSVSSYSGFTGDVPPENPGGSSGNYEIPANTIAWFDFDPQAYEMVDLMVPGEYYFSNVPSELTGILVQLMGMDPNAVLVFPISIPEPCSCLLITAGFLILRRKHFAI